MIGQAILGRIWSRLSAHQQVLNCHEELQIHEYHDLTCESRGLAETVLEMLDEGFVESVRLAPAKGRATLTYRLTTSESL
jgi:hypothetical protein